MAGFGLICGGIVRNALMHVMFCLYVSAVVKYA